MPVVKIDFELSDTLLDYIKCMHEKFFWFNVAMCLGAIAFIEFLLLLFLV